MPARLGAAISIGATGAPTLANPNKFGIAAVTRLSAGTYQIQLSDPYASVLHMQASFSPPMSGSSVVATSFAANTIYQITALGTTDFHAVGLPASVVPAVGAVFKATGAGSGTGTAQTMTVSGISSVEMLGSPNTMVSASSAPLQGGYVIIKCLAPTDASTTTMIATDPANGSTMRIDLLLNNSKTQ